jgi:hypothetical protein
VWRATIDRVAVCVAASDSTTGVITEQHIRRALRLFSWAGRIQGRKSTKGAGTSIDGAVKPVAAHSQWGLRNRPRSRPPPVDARGASQPATVHTLPTTARAENAHTATRPTTRAKEKKNQKPEQGGLQVMDGWCRWSDRRVPLRPAEAVRDRQTPKTVAERAPLWPEQDRPTKGLLPASGS